MDSSNQAGSWIKKAVSSNAFSLIIAVAFFLISYLSKSSTSLFTLVVVIGIGYPLLWNSLSKGRGGLGFFKRNVGESVLWGVGAGIISGLIGTFVFHEINLPDNIGRQLLVGIPLWFLVISPFQEFFFRGWMQTRLSEGLGRWGGLLAANACFTAWHYLSPIVDLAPFPLTSYLGLGSTFMAGLIYGYSFQRSENILAPWLGHAIAGIVFILIGAMDIAKIMG